MRALLEVRFGIKNLENTRGEWDNVGVRRDGCRFPAVDGDREWSAVLFQVSVEGYTRT